MRALKFSYFVGVFLVLAPPCFPHFVKAALGFRLGYSPTEQQAQGRSYSPEKKAVGVQFLSGINNGGWQTGGLKAAASGYGLGNARSAQMAQGSALDAHSAAAAVRHLRILGLNLYLGGRAAHLGLGQPLVNYQPQIVKKSILSSAPYSGVLGSLGNLVSPLNALNLGASVGAGVKPHTVTAANGGKNIGAIAGLRGSVGSPNFGVGFNLGYRQGVNTKSPLGWALGLGSQGLNRLRLASPFASPALSLVNLNKGQDQVILNNGQLLRGHGNQILASPVQVPLGSVSSPNIYLGFPPALESPVASTLQETSSSGSSSSSASSSQASSITNPIASASTQQSQKTPAPNQQNKQNSKSQNQKNQQQVVAQQSVVQPQQIQAPHSGRSYHGPLALGSTMRNNFLSFFRSRPSLLRPSPYQQYSNLNGQLNQQQALGSGPVRMYLNHPQSSPQRQQSLADVAQQGWSTLYPVNGQQSAAASAAFLNPVPVNGQSLSRLQSTLRPGTVQSVPLNTQLTQAQQHIPYVQHQQQQQPRGYGGFLSQGLRGIFGLGGRQPTQQYPQQYYSPQQLQRPQGGLGALTAAQLGGAQLQQAPQQPQQPQFTFFQQPLSNPFQNLQNFQNAFTQNSPFFASSPLQPQSSPVQAALGSNSNNNKQVAASSPFVLPQFPFQADSPAFSSDSKFRYSHSTHSKPLNIASYTLNMDVSNSNNPDASGSASSSAPLYGPGGRRIKKTKKARQDIIIMKKQDEGGLSGLPKLIRQLPLDIMETAASDNQVTLTSSLGSTSWTPMTIVSPPQFTRKSFETPIIVKKSTLLPQSKSLTAQISSSSSSSSSSSNSPERTMILRRRLSAEEIVTAAPTSSTTSAPTASTTVQPSTTTTSSPSSTTVAAAVVPEISSTVASA